MAFRTLAIWLVLLVVAIANGGFRQSVLIPRVGTQAGHIISTLMLCAGILIATCAAARWLSPSTPRDAITIGAAWLALTLAFEFGFGRYRGKSWGELFADYNVLKGRIWILVLVTTAAAPWLMARARGLFSPIPR